MVINATFNNISVMCAFCEVSGCHGRMVVGFTTTCDVQSVPITTKVASSNLAHGEVHLKMVFGTS
jgi:hypothetical protein